MCTWKCNKIQGWLNDRLLNIFKLLHESFLSLPLSTSFSAVFVMTHDVRSVCQWTNWNWFVCYWTWAPKSPKTCQNSCLTLTCHVRSLCFTTKMVLDHPEVANSTLKQSDFTMLMATAYCGSPCTSTCEDKLSIAVDQRCIKSARTGFARSELQRMSQWPKAIQTHSSWLSRIDLAYVAISTLIDSKG